MNEENIARFQAVIDWLNDGREDGDNSAEAILRLPVSEWDGWLAEHPEAATYHTLQSLLDAASTLRRVAIAEFVLAHAGQVHSPENPEDVRKGLRADAWELQGHALREAGDLRGALGAYEQSAQAHRIPPCIEGDSERVERHAVAVRLQLEHEERIHDRDE